MHVVEGPGGTKNLAIGTPKTDQEFKAALNTNEALHWVLHYSSMPQGKLAKAWLKQNYGTDNINKIRKALAKQARPHKSWQDNPLTYASVIITLTVIGGLTTRYLGGYLPTSQTSDKQIVDVKESLPKAVSQPLIETPTKHRFLHLPHWLHLPFQRDSSSE